jgi:hypothetical protein
MRREGVARDFRSSDVPRLGSHNEPQALPDPEEATRSTTSRHAVMKFSGQQFCLLPKRGRNSKAPVAYARGSVTEPSRDSEGAGAPQLE